MDANESHGIFQFGGSDDEDDLELFGDSVDRQAERLKFNLQPQLDMYEAKQVTPGHGLLLLGQKPVTVWFAEKHGPNEIRECIDYLYYQERIQGRFIFGDASTLPQDLMQSAQSIGNTEHTFFQRGLEASSLTGDLLDGLLLDYRLPEDLLTKGLAHFGSVPPTPTQSGNQDGLAILTLFAIQAFKKAQFLLANAHWPTSSTLTFVSIKIQRELTAIEQLLAQASQFYCHELYPGDKDARLDVDTFSKAPDAVPVELTHWYRQCKAAAQESTGISSKLALLSLHQDEEGVHSFADLDSLISHVLDTPRATAHSQTCPETAPCSNSVGKGYPDESLEAILLELRSGGRFWYLDLIAPLNLSRHQFSSDRSKADEDELGTASLNL
ncbi:hypothetical protein BJ085DRAFT_36403 [Dimargaris cristalligena]|uniref:Uncharacterized protein n=1 Tax=Dimargaris cristalligena TaxID=215637 RepID=A0A4V1J5K0_9FUNG|nr:hypothetical protein BJ085DRAFT_36403 [Dimargaris cristalligena]|eukprot:RKP39329.1 hypothetical protein BJ085DRAFT_36403 [Dimargaris cristalligena]